MAKPAKIRGEKKVNSGICRKIRDSFAVSVPGGVSGKMAKMQDIVDHGIDAAIGMIEKGMEKLRKIRRIISKRLNRWFGVSSPGGVSQVAAKIVNNFDFAMDVLGENLVFNGRRGKKIVKAWGKAVWKKRGTYLKYFAAIVLISICMTAVYNHMTGYEYSYNGRVLGLVKNQEDALKVLDVAAKGLTGEYGVDVQIDPKEDISFRKVVTINKTLDSADDVLSKFTYMHDTKAVAYGIYVDGVRAVIVDSETTAKQILDNIESEYVDKDKTDTYNSIKFGQNIHVKQLDTTLGKLMNVTNASRVLRKGENQVNYTVELGDTVQSISEKFGTSEKVLKNLNPDVKISDSTLEEGTRLAVINKTPKVTVITERTSIYSSKIKYKTKKIKTEELYKGTTKVTQKGKNGEREVVAKVVRENGQEIDREILEETIVEKPVTRVVYVGTKKRPPTVGSGKLINPCPAGYQSSSFGPRWGRLHRGIDLACAVGNNIYAADGGTVITAGFNYSYGNYIKIDHQNGMITTYAHCSSLLVSAGTKVHKGEIIALVGSTGNSTGAHLHFEVEVNGSLINPRSYF